MKRSDTSIRTGRLWLRQIDETDAESIVSLRSDESVYQYFQNPIKLTMEDHKQWYREVYCCQDDRIDWIAVVDETGKFIGVYGAKLTDLNSVELSYIANSDSLRCGYSREAINAVMTWCSTHWKNRKFIASVHNSNHASIAFIRKMGFNEENADGKFTVFGRENADMFLDEDLKVKRHSEYTNVVVTIDKGQNFFNAEDTADDVIKTKDGDWSDSFIEFWKKKTGTTDAELNKMSCSNLDCEHGTRRDAYELEGAHIVKSGHSSRLNNNDEVYIVPLCPKCNNPDNKLIMTIRRDVKAPKLRWKVEVEV